MDSWIPSNTLGATEAQIRAWIARNQPGEAVIDTGEYAGGAGRCGPELPANDAIQDALAEEAAAPEHADVGIGPLLPFEEQREVYEEEKQLPYLITKWRDIARDRGQASAQAKQQYASILETITRAKAAARARGHRRAFDLMVQYEDTMRNHTADVLVRDMSYATGLVKELPTRRRRL
jgi:hypothetical protein